MAIHIPATPLSASQREFLQQRFGAMVSRLGVTVVRATTLDAIADLVAERTAVVVPEVRRVVLAPGLEATFPAYCLRQRLEARGITLTPVDVADPTATFGPAAVGISGASLGIAETGSYLIADGLEDRLVRMLAHRHIVVLPVERLVPSLDEAGAWLRDRFTGADGAPAGRYASFITGPSRTADIEMSLSVGAHGPAELRIVLLDLASNNEGGDHAGE